MKEDKRNKVKLITGTQFNYLKCRYEPIQPESKSGDLNHSHPRVYS